eukprot:1157252-Pelagomonas_calceolata.AAC.1
MMRAIGLCLFSSLVHPVLLNWHAAPMKSLALLRSDGPAPQGARKKDYADQVWPRATRSTSVVAELMRMISPNAALSETIYLQIQNDGTQHSQPRECVKSFRRATSVAKLFRVSSPFQVCYPRMTCKGSSLRGTGWCLRCPWIHQALHPAVAGLLLLPGTLQLSYQSQTTAVQPHP